MNLLDASSSYLVFKKSIHIQFHIHLSNEIAFDSASGVFNGADNVCSINDALFRFFSEHPKYSFVSHLAVNCHSFESSLPFLKFTVNGITADFSYSVYSGVIQALLKNNPEVELGAPFASEVCVDVTVLQENEFTQSPVNATIVNRNVDLTPISAIPELVGDKSARVVDALRIPSELVERVTNAGLCEEAVVVLEAIHTLLSLNRIVACDASYLWGGFPFSASAVSFNSTSPSTSTSTTSPSTSTTTLPSTSTSPSNSTLPSTTLVNYNLNALFAELLHHSCIVIGKLLPSWLEAIFFFTPQLFSFATRRLFLFLLLLRVTL